MDFKKILIAVDVSENSARAVNYVGEIIGNIKGFQVELLAIDRPPQKDLFPNEETWLAQRRKQEEQIREFLKNSRGILESKGVPSENISEIYMVSEGLSIAHAILKVQQDGGNGTIVVGRRGVSKDQEFLFGSVSNKIVHYAKECSVWVVE